MHANNFSSEEMLKTIKEESRIYEENLENRIKEESEKLKNTLKQIKKEMEKFNNNNEIGNSQEDERNNHLIENDNTQLNPIDNEILKKIENSPLSPIPNFPDKSPYINEINSMNNTANTKFFNNRQEINNDSALSSFHIHNINKTKDKLKKTNDIKDRTVKIPHKINNNSRLSKENSTNSKDNSFSRKMEVGNQNKNDINHKNEQNTNNETGENFNYDKTTSEPKYKRIQLNSLSLSVSKDKDMDFGVDRSYSEYNLQNSENNRKNRVTEQNTPHKNKENVDINDFSKSGTFKSHSNAKESPQKNRQDYYNNIHSESNNYDTNSNFYVNNNNNYMNNLNRQTASDYSNFYKEGAKNFSETISDLQSIGKEIRNNESYLDYPRSVKDNGTMSNFNVNSSTLNEMIKRDLHEYLSNLENKQMIKLNTNKKNEWVLQFKEDISMSMSSPNVNSESEDEKRHPKVEGTNNPNSLLKSRKENSVKETKKIIDQKKKYAELKNEIEILKKEKQGLKRYLTEKEKEKDSLIMNRKNQNKNNLSKGNLGMNSSNLKKSVKTNGDKKSDYTVNENNSHSHSLNNGDQNSNYNSASKFSMNRDSLSLKQYESEVLEKIKNEDIFSDETDNHKLSHDYLGEFVDRVIERSLYIYKNKNCHTCSRLLSTGKSTSLCPKNHK